jgi:hypothetical protein
MEQIGIEIVEGVDVLDNFGAIFSLLFDLVIGFALIS